MRHTIWRVLLGPPSVVIAPLLLVIAVVPAAIAAAPPGPAVPACPPHGPHGVGRAVHQLAVGRLVDETLISSRGEVTGRRLTVNSAGRDAAVINLPPESFATAPTGNLVVYGWHGPATGSEVRGLTLDGCDVRLARPAGVVRSAALDPAGAALYVHSVTGADRRDGGVVRHDLATGARTQVVPPLPPSPLYGLTFATRLAWSADGTELAVQSCGADACRTRILDSADGRVTTYDAAPHGTLLGFDREVVFAYDACHWSPCDVIAIERASGERRLAAEQVRDARAATSDGSLRLTVETSAGTVEVAP